MVRCLSLALFACLIFAACGDKDLPPAPAPGGSTGEVQISGNERIGWSQPAVDVSELALFEFVVYVDGARMPLTSVSCASTATAVGFDCSAALPPLTQGAHTLELASVVVDQAAVLESSRSAPLRVIMTGIRTTSSSSSSTFVKTADGVTLVLESVADGLHAPSDIAFGRNGSIFVAERGGAVRIVRDGSLVAEPALDLSGEITVPHGGLLAVSVDPKFEENGFLYTLYAADAPRGGLEFILARFRGVEQRFGERAILLDRIEASAAGARGALRFGPDGKLYAALDGAADDRAPGSYGSYNGKILRLNADATTPDDQSIFTPIYSLDHPQPTALDWHPGSGDLWVIDTTEPSGGLLSAVTARAAPPRRAALRTAYTLPQGTGATSAAFYRGELMPVFRGNLFIAAETGHQLIRLKFDPDNATRITAVDRLLKDEIGPVRVVAEGRDGALYVASDTALYRMRP
jgi:glucose/arabinose dehydrogenase